MPRVGEAEVVEVSKETEEVGGPAVGKVAVLWVEWTTLNRF